jgi:hypothetical protein
VTEGVVHAYNKSERVNGEGEPPEESGIVILFS